MTREGTRTQQRPAGRFHERAQRFWRRRGRPVLGVHGGFIRLQIVPRITAARGDQRPRGFGLANMERRLAEIGGSLILRPRKPKGTVVEASIPRVDAEVARPIGSGPRVSSGTDTS